MAQDRFNFVYDGKHVPNYRVEFETKNGTPSISSPAIFSNDAEAIETALRNRADYLKIGLNIVIVKKYTKKSLVEIFRLAC